MFRRVLPSSFLLATLCAAPCASQTAGQRDPQAVSILTQSLNAVGGAQVLGSIQDFVATGSITYFWAGEQVQGHATVRARGLYQLRLDANPPQGTRSWSVSQAGGTLRESNGALSEIPPHNTMNLGILAFPYLNILEELSDPLVGISYLGLVQVDGRSLQQVHVQRTLTAVADPGGALSRLLATDYFVDPSSGLIFETVDMTHPVETFTVDLTHEIQLENYTPVQGVTVPTFIVEKIDGVTTWQLQLSGFHVNQGLTDLDFVIQ